MNLVQAPDGFEPKKRGHTRAYAELLSLAQGARDAAPAWVICEGMTFSSAHTAKVTAYRIRSGKRAAFNAVGSFESTWKDNEDGTYSVLVKYAG